MTERWTIETGGEVWELDFTGPAVPIDVRARLLTKFAGRRCGLECIDYRHRPAAELVDLSPYPRLEDK